MMNNLKEYSSRSTIHGISYVFDKDIPIADRFLWLIVLGLSCSLVGSLILNSFDSWQQDMVVTTIKNKAKSVTDLEFPALTICSAGTHMSLVEKVIYNKFEKWQEGSSYSMGNMTLKDRLQKFMKEMFQVKNEGDNILDILSTMIAPSSESSSASRVVNNERACNSDVRRKKRSSQGLHLIMKLQPVDQTDQPNCALSQLITWGH